MGRRQQAGAARLGRPREGLSPVPERGRWARFRLALATAADPDAIAVLARPGPRLAASEDDAEAASVLLARAEAADGGWDRGEEVIVRFVVAVPGGQRESVVAIAGEDGYLAGEAGPDLVALARLQRVDARHLAQERSRMASLAQRAGGAVVRVELFARADRADRADRGAPGEGGRRR